MQHDGSFFKTFVSRYWGKEPCVLERGLYPPFATSAEVYQLLFSASEAWRKNRNGNFGIWLDDGFNLKKLSQLFMAPQDRDLASFINRVTESGTHHFCWAQYHAQLFAPQVWERALPFLATLFSQIGFPTGEVDLDVFLGQYLETPRGIHTDAADTFMYVVQGTKRIALWPLDYFTQPRHVISGPSQQRTLYEADTQMYLKDALILEGTPGDLLYWPASYWHIGINTLDTGLTIALNIGITRHRPQESMILSVLQDLLGQINGDTWTTGRDGTTMAAIGALPHQDTLHLGVIEEFLKQGLLEKLMYTEWFKRVSALGFQRVPYLAETKDFLPEQVLTRRIPTLPLCYKQFGEDLLIGGHGRVATCQYQPALIQFLVSLSKCKTYRLKPHEISDEALLSLVRLLFSWGVIT